MLQLLEAILEGLMLSANQALPPSRRVPRAVIHAEVTELRPLIENMLWQQNVMSAHYIYRHISDADLEAYIRFLESAMGRRYVDLAHGGLSHVLNELFSEIFERGAPRPGRNGTHFLGQDGF